MSKKKKKKKQKGSIVPFLCNLFGTLILLAVILSAVPLTLPRFLGYEVYNVVSGSMEPVIPVGSIIYVEETQPNEVQVGDIIAYQSGDSVIAHRVVANQIVSGYFNTKGDANAEADFSQVPYDSLIGRVAYHFPYLGLLLLLYASTVGKAYLLCFAACGALLNIIAARLRNRNSAELFYKEMERIQGNQEKDMDDRMPMEDRKRAESGRKSAAAETKGKEVSSSDGFVHIRYHVSQDEEKNRRDK